MKPVIRSFFAVEGTTKNNLQLQENRTRCHGQGTL